MTKLLSSRTVWTILLMFAVGGVNAVMPVVPVAFVPYVEGILGLAAVYFKMNPSQTY